MDRESAIDRLPTLHATAIRLRDRGADDREIATELGLETGDLAPVLRVAEAKLARLMATGGGN